MYEYADKIIKYLKREIYRKFSNTKSVLRFDELNVITKYGELYDELLKLCIQMYLKAANNEYKKHNSGKVLPKSFITSLLNEYDPTTLYVFTHEVTRKKARSIESFVASEGDKKQVDASFKYFAAMAAWYVITVTDAARIKGFKDIGVKEVVWRAEKDGKECKICRERDGKVYKIDKVPPKPHHNCRCWLEKKK
ncbi:MAG: minor capsid protein [Clostridia bacterium]|nr:minor capsid protein [Clostridia bacterium]